MWTWDIGWRRILRGWEQEEYDRLRALLEAFSPNATKVDGKKWVHSSDVRYLERATSDLLANNDSVLPRDLCYLIQSRYVPGKVSIFGWRTVLDDYRQWRPYYVEALF